MRKKGVFSVIQKSHDKKKNPYFEHWVFHPSGVCVLLMLELLNRK